MCIILPELLEKFFLQQLLLLPLLVSIIFLYKWFDAKKNTIHKNAPPSPPKLPILGHIHQLGMHPHRSLQSLSKKYGDLMLIYLGNKPTLIVSSASVAKEIIKSHDAIVSNRPKSSIFDRLLYNSRDVAGAPYGEYWRQMKSICVLQLLSNRRVRSYRAIREEETALLVEKIEQAPSEVNLSELFIELTNGVVCRAAFGRKYSQNQQGGINFKEVLKDFVELLGIFNLGDFIPWLSWVNRFNGLNKRLDEVSRKFDALLEDILNDHLDQISRQGDHRDSENGDKAKDFVDVLLEVQRENTAGFPIERDSIKALILDAFAAGTDTTYTVLEWAMAELLRNSRVMKELQKEVRGITRDNEKVTEDYLEKMVYLKAVVKETLRLHPPIPLLVPRESTQELEVNGYDIANMTQIIINAWAIHRDPVTWEEPEEFRPERFLDSPVDFKGQDFQLIPFGGGRRVCPGISFAMVNNELVLATVIHKFNWELPAGAKGKTLDMSESAGLTVHRRSPLLAVATPYLLVDDPLCSGIRS